MIRAKRRHSGYGYQFGNASITGINRNVPAIPDIHDGVRCGPAPETIQPPASRQRHRRPTRPARRSAIAPRGIRGLPRPAAPGRSGDAARIARWWQPRFLNQQRSWRTGNIPEMKQTGPVQDAAFRRFHGRQSAYGMDRLAQHVRRDQHDAVPGHVETAPAVFLRVLANHHALRDLAAAVDDGARDNGVASDRDFR